jgi:septum formation inhibitor-activating ATPase MinD
MKTHLMIIIGITIYGCSTEKTVVIQLSNKSQPITRSRSLESQRELADLMDSWTCEEIEEFKRKYVYSEVNIFLKNGDTLTVKKK